MHLDSANSRRFAAAVVACLAIYGLTGCALISPPPASAPTSTAVNESVQDSDACRSFVDAFTLFNKAAAADGSAASFGAAYEDLAFKTGQAAVDAAQGSDVQVAIREVAEVAAAAADELKTTGGSSVKQRLAYRTSINTAMKACGRPAIDFGN